MITGDRSDKDTASQDANLKSNEVWQDSRAIEYDLCSEVNPVDRIPHGSAVAVRRIALFERCLMGLYGDSEK